ncbi:MAG: 1-acyl-sn-glycerol-3-phosphate acyltransferase [Hyphomicrobiales bacterium]|nr:1-acyl-sn-glycerol-3-phosphate acyltransferase [Hyphomicrobiales bacterium]
MTAIRLFLIGALLALALPAALVLAPFRRPAAALRMGLCRAACRLLGLRVVVEGASPPPGALIVANHVSWTDVLALGALTPCRFLARHDVAQWPLIGPLAKANGALFVERGRKRQIPGVNAAMADALARGDSVVLFPEATTGDGTRLLRFHAPHFAAARDLLARRADLAHVVLAPAALAYTRRNGLPLGRAGRANVAWHGEKTFAPHLVALVRSGGAECRVTFLQLIEFSRKTDRKAAARAARGAILAETSRLVHGAARQTGRQHDRAPVLKDGGPDCLCANPVLSPPAPV